MRRMAKPPMTKHTFYAPEPLWQAALAKAEERQESLSDVLREALERYVKRG